MPSELYKMGRILAIDYGQKRIGLAATDPEQIIANGLDTVSPDKIFQFLTDYFAKETVEKVVIGKPQNMNGEASASMKYIEPFVKGFKNKFPDMPIEFHDERFTSVLANRAILESGVKKKERRENKKLVDKVSAVIILQSYLESQRMKFF